MDVLDLIYIIFAFLFGAVIGSFLNVLTYRLPAGISIVKPGSHCFSCGAPIKWYDNIPILSYLILGGKCRNCKKSYSPQYFLVELFTAFVYVGTYLVFRQSFSTILVCIVMSCFIVIAIIDFKHMEIPDSMNIGIALMGIVGFFIKDECFNIVWYDKLISIGVVLLIMMILIVASKIVKKDLMGFGDIKLFFAFGLFGGYKLLLLGIFVAALLGLIIEVIIFRKKEKAIPFGPYLVMGFTFSIFLGLPLLNWYASLFI